MGALKLTTRFFMAALRWIVRQDRGGGAFGYEGFAASRRVCLRKDAAENRCGSRQHAGVSTYSVKGHGNR